MGRGRREMNENDNYETQRRAEKGNEIGGLKKGGREGKP